MASITTRAAKGTPLTHAEVDANFTNLNTDKLDVAGIASGTAASPTIKFTGDLTTGIYRVGAGQLGFTSAGTQRFVIDSSGQLEASSLGSAALPVWSFVSDPNTGIYSPGADQLALSTGGTGRLFVDASGRVGIGVTPSTTLDVAGPIRSLNGTIDARLQAGYAGAVGIGAQSNDAVLFIQNATERLRIDSSGRLLVGASASITAVTFPSLVQSNSFYSYQSSLFSADANGSNTFFLKSRNATTGSHTVVQANDVLGQINFAGSDGANFVLGANIAAVVDGTPGTNDMPGRLVFSTTADGAASSTEQLRISNGGTVIYNQPAPAAVDVTATLTVANLTAKIITSSTAAAVTMTLPTGTLMDGGFSGLYTNMAFEWSVINTGATNAVTVQGGTGHTVVGSGTIAASNAGRFLSRRTGATTWVTYRLAS
jgi:hypothetical protein